MKAIDTVNLKEQLATVSSGEINDLKSELGITGSQIAIFCGGMYAEKRIDFILESCYIIKKAVPEFQMLFIGSGEMAPLVKQASETSGWIHYLGVKSGIERIKYFKIAQIQLMPGAVGLGILDSFALETPIITTSCGTHGPEIEYLENGTNGIITAENIEAYTQTIIEILKTEKYLELIDGCKTSANIYTVEAMVKNFAGGVLKCLG